MRGLEGRRIVVTGGASGIGKATVQRLMQEGCIVGSFDLNAGAAQEVIGEGKGRAYSVDITKEDQVRAGLEAFERNFGPTDGLANVAGWDKAMPFLETDRPLWDKVIDINLYGLLNMHKVFLPGMVERQSGRIVNVASDAGRAGSSGEAVYAACKGGTIAFSKTIARECASKGIAVNVVCPGPTDTPLFATIQDAFGGKLGDALVKATPLRRLGKPDDYPGMIAFLLSADSEYMTGQTISISGGLTMM